MRSTSCVLKIQAPMQELGTKRSALGRTGLPRARATTDTQCHICSHAPSFAPAPTHAHAPAHVSSLAHVCITIVRNTLHQIKSTIAPHSPAISSDVLYANCNCNEPSLKKQKQRSWFHCLVSVGSSNTRKSIMNIFTGELWTRFCLQRS